MSTSLAQVPTVATEQTPWTRTADEQGGGGA
jgi:hypothetical protein